MTDAPLPPLRQRTLAFPLLLAWTALIVYASLYPFDGWRVPAGLSASGLLGLPWPSWRDRFDEIANLLGYVPFGALACIVLLRQRRSPKVAVGLAVGLAAGLSYGVELAQAFVPVRVPSLKDTLLNALGATAGAAAVAVLHGTDLTRRFRRFHDQWFGGRAALGLSLLLLWPIGLLFPAPVPLGLGQGWTVILDWMREALSDTPFEIPPWTQGPASSAALHAIAPEHEQAIVALGLLAPCLVAYAATPHAQRRAGLALGAACLAFGVTTLSVAMSFGPDHALSWITPNVLGGLGAGVALAVFSIAMPPRAAAWFGVMVLVGLVAAVVHAPPDPYYAEHLSQWERGRFIRFHGIAQWIGWLWPLVAAVWLVARALSRQREA